ncbi:glycosyltransferase family 4 protein [Thiohalorhabdus sp. Cl-TMA]|uniref:Glycosyltransferase family 4 protein n=1 Tax=Thiohalorhabdus methylotrophus TaxID=3242694 RepID=A0ABV4TSP2_9GAMM
MRIAIVTDAWTPQINGVVTSLGYTRRELEALGHEVRMVTPQGTRTVGLPTYPDIRVALRPRRLIREAFREFQPDAVHIVTEGPLGLAARSHCRRRGLAFTTSFHTRFPEYIQLRLPFVPLEWGYAFLRWFHRAGRRTMVTNETMRAELETHGIRNLVFWSRGVDTELFRPREKDFLTAERPIFLYVGRVAVEKNLEAFLRLNLPGTKYVVGDGPARRQLEEEYPDAVFTGFKQGEELARHLAAADVFVFPSRTDTLGLVMYEAMACGVPVAAYPVQGPRNVVAHGVTGCLDEDLATAATEALKLDPRACREAALARSWRSATEEFLDNLTPARPAPLAVGS